jgi:4-diphosphocytidyl-2-C-methyl-D-erythritol kinase
VTNPERLVEPVVRLAPAKVNLTLAVVGRRPDGFHEIHSVMVPLDLADRIVLSPAPGPLDRLDVQGPGGGPPPDLGPEAANLALRALATARQALRGAGVDGPLPCLAVRLEKLIPVAAGLAGGSSDGAAVLDGALEAWGAQERLSPAARLAAAAELGSDCPFFLAGGWALVEGRGERVERLPAPRGEPPGIVVVTPGIPTSTAAVFASHAVSVQPPRGAALATSAHLAAELRAGLTSARFLDRAGLLAVANDLLPAAAELVPALLPLRRALGRLLGRPVGLSGSGPTLWALFPSRPEAEVGAAAVRRALAEGSLVAPGERPCFVAAASLANPQPPSGAPAGEPGPPESSSGRPGGSLR